MRLRLETTPAELSAKGDALVKALSDALRPADPELAERLAKALPPREHDLKYPALQEIHGRMAREYGAMQSRMLRDIGRVLERPRKRQEPVRGSQLQKAEPPQTQELEKAGGPYVGPKGGKWADPQHTIPWKEAAPKKARKHLFHTTGYHRMEDIAEHGLQPRAGSGTFQGGGYAEHSQGKVFLADSYSAATEWAHKVQQQLQDQSDKTHEQIPVMLRAKHRRTSLDEVGEQDVSGSRFTRRAIPPEDLEFYHPGKGWLPVSDWGKDTGTEHAVKERDEHGAYLHEPGEGGYTPTSREHAHARSEATETAAAKRGQAQKRAEEAAAAEQAQKREAAAEQEAGKSKALAAARADYPGEKRREKVAELLAQKRKGPIPGVDVTGLDGGTEVQGHRLSWREILQVDREGNDLRKAELAQLLEKAGPYIGPRGGKWADPQHKVPWVEPGEEKKHVQIPLKVHAKIGGGGEHTLHVAHAGGGKVHVSPHGPGKHGPTMPAESLRHFINDLAGRVEGPETDHKHIGPVLAGKAEFLGKGDDGLAFRVGDKVVKVSTTVPYVPENPGHRTPKQAVEMLREQSRIGNMLADKGIEGVQRSTFVEHGDKGFQIKPYVEIPEKFTREQLDAIQDTLIEIHKAGYSVNDAIQAGLQDGKPVMFDVGKASEIPESDDRKGIYSPVTADMEAMQRLYQDHGQVFVRRDYSVAQQRLQDLLGRWDKTLQIGDGKFAQRQLLLAMEKRAAELHATLKGKELDDALDDLDSSTWAERMELEDKGLAVPTVGPSEAGEAGEEAKKSLSKARASQAEDFEDHSQPIAERDERAYKRIQVYLQRKGYRASDFEPGGPLHGWSVNQLLELAHGKRD